MLILGTHVELQFTNIDSRNPERIFSISVKINEHRTVSGMFQCSIWYVYFIL